MQEPAYTRAVLLRHKCHVDATVGACHPALQGLSTASCSMLPARPEPLRSGSRPPRNTSQPPRSYSRPRVGFQTGWHSSMQAETSQHARTRSRQPPGLAPAQDNFEPRIDSHVSQRLRRMELETLESAARLHEAETQAREALLRAETAERRMKEVEMRRHSEEVDWCKAWQSPDLEASLDTMRSERDAAMQRVRELERRLGEKEVEVSACEQRQTDADERSREASQRLDKALLVATELEQERASAEKRLESRRCTLWERVETAESRALAAEEKAASADAALNDAKSRKGEAMTLAHDMEHLRSEAEERMLRAETSERSANRSLQEVERRLEETTAKLREAEALVSDGVAQAQRAQSAELLRLEAQRQLATMASARSRQEEDAAAQRDAARNQLVLAEAREEALKVKVQQLELRLENQHVNIWSNRKTALASKDVIATAEKTSAAAEPVRRQNVWSNPRAPLVSEEVQATSEEKTSTAGQKRQNAWSTPQGALTSEEHQADAKAENTRHAAEQASDVALAPAGVPKGSPKEAAPPKASPQKENNIAQSRELERAQRDFEEQLRLQQCEEEERSKQAVEEQKKMRLQAKEAERMRREEDARTRTRENVRRRQEKEAEAKAEVERMRRAGEANLRMPVEKQHESVWSKPKCTLAVDGEREASASESTSGTIEETRTQELEEEWEETKQQRRAEDAGMELEEAARPSQKIEAPVKANGEGVVGERSKQEIQPVQAASVQAGDARDLNSDSALTATEVRTILQADEASFEGLLETMRERLDMEFAVTLPKISRKVPSRAKLGKTSLRWMPLALVASGGCAGGEALLELIVYVDGGLVLLAACGSPQIYVVLCCNSPDWSEGDAPAVLRCASVLGLNAACEGTVCALPGAMVPSHNEPVDIYAMRLPGGMAPSVQIADGTVRLREMSPSLPEPKPLAANVDADCAPTGSDETYWDRVNRRVRANLALAEKLNAATEAGETATAAPKSAPACEDIPAGLGVKKSDVAAEQQRRQNRMVGDVPTQMNAAPASGTDASEHDPQKLRRCRRAAGLGIYVLWRFVVAIWKLLMWIMHLQSLGSPQKEKKKIKAGASKTHRAAPQCSS